MRRMNAIAMTAVAATAALVTLGGCKNDDPFPGQGVTKEYRSFIPKTATKVAEGTGSVKYTATGQGTVFLVDKSRSEQTTEEIKVPWVAGSYLMLPGQTIVVNGGAHEVKVSGKDNVTPTTFKAPNLTGDSKLELHFDPKVEK